MGHHATGAGGAVAIVDSHCRGAGAEGARCAPGEGGRDILSCSGAGRPCTTHVSQPSLAI